MTRISKVLHFSTSFWKIHFSTHVMPQFLLMMFLLSFCHLNSDLFTYHPNFFIISLLVMFALKKGCVEIISN